MGSAKLINCSVCQGPWSTSSKNLEMVAIVGDMAESITRIQRHKPGIIRFIKARVRTKPQHRAATGLLGTVSDWQLLVDVERQLTFPGFITPEVRHGSPVNKIQAPD